MDHLQIPKNEHVIDYSCPRACFVTTADFIFITKIDLDPKILLNKTIFGRRTFLELSQTPYGVASVKNLTHEEPEVNPSASLNEWLVFPSMQEMEVPLRFKHVYEKHKVLFATAVDSTLKTLGSGLKSMQSHHMSRMLNDVDAAMKETDGPSVVFPTNAACDGQSNMGNDTVPHEFDADEEDEEIEAKTDDGVAKDGTGLGDVAAADTILSSQNASTGIIPEFPQAAVLIDSSGTGGDVIEKDDANSPVRHVVPSPTRKRKIEIGYWDDFPNFTLWSQDCDFKRVEDIPTQKSDPVVTCADKEATDGNMPIAELGATESLSGEETNDVPNAATPDNTTDNVVADVIDEKATTGVKTIEKKTRFKRARKEDLVPKAAKKFKVSQNVLNFRPFILIGRIHCEYRSFHSSLSVRGYVSTQVMGVWTKDFNKESKKESDKNKGALKKYAFSCYFTGRLIVDPAQFDPSEIMKEFKSENAEYQLLRKDLLHFPVVENNHWIVCTTNILHTQFHIFDSMMSPKKRSILEKSARNLFMNFSTLTQASGICNINWDHYLLKTPNHPKQKTVYDCGMFAMLFMEHFNAKVMQPFDKDNIPAFCMAVAASLIESRENEGNIVEIMEAELEY